MAIFLNKHKVRLRNIFLIQINDLQESNQECGTSVEETAKSAGFLSKFRRFLAAENTWDLFCADWPENSQFHSRKLLLNAGICS